MKLSKNTKNPTKGFTLIELLVVIAILAALGGLSYGPIMKYLESANITKEKKICKDLVFAVTSFEQEYDSLPYTGNYPNEDESIHTGSAEGRGFLEVLMGIDTDINDRGKTFFTAQEAEGGKKGIIYNDDGSIHQLKDRWGKVYFIRLDYSADGIIDVSKIGESFVETDDDSYIKTLRGVSSIAATRGSPSNPSYDDGQPKFDGIGDATSW